MSYTETVELVEHHPREIEHNAPAGMAIAPDKGSLPAAVALPATVTASGSDRPARVSTAMSAESGGRVFTAIEPVIITPPENKGKRSLIVSLLIFANLVQFMSNIVTVTGGLALSKTLGRDAGAGKANWMAASFSLTQGAFMLITGRLGAIYGHQKLAELGLLIFAVFSLASAFCRSYDSFIATRALTGVGGGVFMPNAVTVLTLMVPPGRARNITLGFFAAAPPLGGVMGAVMVGPIADSGNIWHWTALFGAIQAPSVGWSKPYNIAILVVSVTLFLIFLGWEQYYARDPIMPLSVFRTPTFAALIFVVLLSYMAFGILLWYAISWQQTLRHVSVLQTGINLLPFAAGSVIAVGLAAYLLPRIAAQWIMALGVAVVLIACLLLATMPVDQSYWPQTFPAILLSSFCPDFVYLAAQVIASNSVSYKHQGVASSLVGTLNLYGNSLGLGFAGTIETEIAKRVGSSAGGNHMNDVLENVAGTVSGYRAALYFGAAIAAVGLALDFAFVRVPKDEREGWDPEEDVPDAVLTATATSVNRTNSV
ncbi:hypothetical protein K4F52_005493 [Lecanicillium sp. MT-2017a]|nr:hypothetical protein K4F52_005493 [Lecanicillium sp. MT-2017a]